MQPLALISICSSLVLVRFASTLVIRSRSKLNRCETTSRRWFSLIRIKLLIRISWCSVNARKGAKPVSLRIKSASVNGVEKARNLGCVFTFDCQKYTHFLKSRSDRQMTEIFVSWTEVFSDVEMTETPYE